MNKWTDNEDKEIQIDLNKSKFQKLKRKIKKDKINVEEYQNYFQTLNNSNFTKWSLNKDIKNNNKLDKFLKNQNKFNSILSLKTNTINIKKICKTNYEQKLNSIVNANDIKDNFILMGGFDKILKIFKLENDILLKENNIYFESMPILNSKFMNIKNEWSIISLNKPFVGFYDLEKNKLEKLYKIFDFKYTIEKFVKSENDNYMAILPTKNNGNISLINPIHKQIIHEFKTNEECNDLCINGKYLFASTVLGKIYQFDIEQRKIFDIINDVGSTNTIKLTSKFNKLITGTKFGMVNIYDINNCNLIKNPVKSFDNLTYEINYLDIDDSSNFLFFGSKWKQNSIRIANLNENKVVKNWPNVKTNIGKICSLSTRNDLLSWGNENGNLNIYRFN